MDAADHSDSNQDVDEERSDDSEEEAAESDSQSSEAEDDVASRDKDEEKEMSAPEAVEGEDDDGEDKSDSKSSTSSRKPEDVSDDELDEDSDDTDQIAAVHREGPQSPESETARSPEPVDMDSISGSEKLPSSPKEAVITQDNLISCKSQNEQPPDSLMEEESSNKLSSDLDKQISCPISTGNIDLASESLPVQGSSDSLPHLEVLSVSETKSEFARHPDSTSKQQLSQHVDDQEAELDFEEEVSEDRKEEVEGGEDGEKSQDEDDKDRSKEDGENIEDADDDGEVEDDDDLEEGEVKDTASSSRKPLQRPICRFFNKGQCTWGTSCRFIHPGINDKGNYNMFGPTKPLVPSNGPLIGGLLGGPLGPLRGHPGYGGRLPAEVVVPPPPVDDVPPVESAWERGLRHAKENLKKANKRKEMEPDFEEKRFNLTLGAGEPEFEKENDYFARSPFRKNNDPYQAYGYEEPPDPIDRQAQEYWRGGNYENFEVRYLRNDYDNYREKEKEIKERSRREKSSRYDHGRNQERGGRDGGWRDNRYAEVQVTSRNRADEWKDPWRRSTSPKRRGRSKSYSSASSGSSYSSGSSRSRSSSFSSHSRSSSGSSYSSRSRSRSRNRPSPHRHRSSAPSSSSAPRKKQPPPPSVQKSQALPPKSSRPPPEKRLTSSLTSSTPLPSLPPEQKKKRPPVPPSEKPPSVEKRPLPARVKRPRSPSLSRSESGSSRSRSSRSSMSRSSSRSSVSSRSSSRSSSVSSASDVERKANGVRKRAEQEQEHKLMAHLDPQTKAGGATRGSKDPLKQSGQKPQIKLTLLNKAKPMPEKTGISTLPHKDSGTAAKTRPQVAEKETKMAPKLPPPAVILGLNKPAKTTPTAPLKTEAKPGPPVKTPAAALTMEPSKVSKPAVPSSGGSRKRAAPSPSPPRGLAGTPVGNKTSPSVPSQQPPPPPPPPLSAPAKKSTLSRREELLKQLKAVEDAIARKRAKLT